MLSVCTSHWAMWEENIWVGHNKLYDSKVAAKIFFNSAYRSGETWRSRKSPAIHSSNQVCACLQELVYCPCHVSYGRPPRYWPLRAISGDRTFPLAAYSFIQAISGATLRITQHADFLCCQLNLKRTIMLTNSIWNGNTTIIDFLQKPTELFFVLPLKGHFYCHSSSCCMKCVVLSK